MRPETSSRRQTHLFLTRIRCAAAFARLAASHAGWALVDDNRLPQRR
jgi:hypothetical protein